MLKQETLKSNNYLYLNIILKSMATKEQIKQKEQEIIDLARKLCKEKISEEYADLSEKLIRKLGRKHDMPFKLGRS